MRSSDWSSDVCSSDLGEGARRADEGARAQRSAAFDSGCSCKRAEQLAALAPSSGAARHLLPLRRRRAKRSCWRRNARGFLPRGLLGRSEEHTSELQSLMRISYAVFCLKKKKIILNLIVHTTIQII